MKNEPKLLSKIDYASFLIYSPRGKSEISVKSRKVRDAIKRDEPDKIEAIVDRLLQYITNFPGWFGIDVTLIPVPRSAPFPRGPYIAPENTLWVSKQICMALVKKGLAAEMLPCLQRVQAVRKSAFSLPGERPSIIEHYESIVCNPAFISGQTILIIDDVITKGRTMLAAASAVANTFPSCTVRGFTLLRTMGLMPEIERIIDCCIGSVQLINMDAVRDP